MIKRLIFLASLLLCTLTTVPCFGWGDGGHMAIALRAWDALTTAQREAAMQLLRQNPRFQSDMVLRMPATIPPADRDRWLFACCATWPDYVWKLKVIAPADFKKYFHGGWHVIGLHVAIDPNDQDTVVPLKPPASTQNINELTVREALPMQIEELNDTSLPAADRAVAMCWVMHMIGDLHEPCHCASLISNRFKAPDGDHVATKIPALADGHRIGLHQYWDSLYCSSTDWEKLSDWDQSVLNDPDLQPGTLSELKEHPAINQWIAESFNDAVHDVYTPDVRAEIAAQDVDLSKPFVPIALSDQYMEKARKVGRRRGALAGLRLADTLAKVPW